jgi:hypothetical protein
MSPKAIEREFPYTVEIAVPAIGLGSRLDAMHQFHTSKNIKACLGRGRHEGGQDYLRWYFTNSKIAATFAAEFGGSVTKLAERAQHSSEARSGGNVHKCRF